MRTTHICRLTSWIRRGRFGRALLAVFLVATLGAPMASWAGPASGPPSAPPSVPGGGAGHHASPGHGGGETHQITLLTGDVVVLHTDATGQQSAWVQDPAGPRGSTRAPQIYEQDGQVHIVPAEAAPYVASGALDPHLFNLTLLAQQGFDDESSHDLPLLLQSKGGPRAQTAPAAPTGTRKVRELHSIATVSVTAPKQRMRSVWTRLRGSHAAPVDADHAQLAGAGKVWLNAMVQATAAPNIEQIRAPEAWAAGYDGNGVDIAVLDSGYDPTHPDLAGRVTKAKDFTGEPDPPGETAVDRNGHGTHVASIAAGSSVSEGGAHEGVAPGADLWIGKVLNGAGEGPIGQIIAGMQWAANADADVINMSLGTPYPTDGTDPLSQAVNQLTTSTGALFVVAAGNAGPAEGTVTAPGSADLALTVGAVDRNDRAADFSSRGPRVGDMAIKPEIVAPGVDIVAARAAGTSLGNLRGRYYTSLSGTSMATPHVAGSAAILAQKHPGWSAARLKAHLVATSKALVEEPVTFQGGGRVDVAAAVQSPVTVDAAALSLGHVPYDASPVTRTLTYRNLTDSDQRLRLSPDVAGTGVDPHERPRIRLSTKHLQIPAGGTASVDVVLQPGRTDSGGYAGQVVADVVGRSHVAVHTPISFVVDGPERTLTVHAVDRQGNPAQGPVDVWSADTGDYQRVWLRDGTATATVADGLYTVMTTISTSPFSSPTQTIAGDPNLKVTGDVTLSYDARDAKPMTVTTPREADLDSVRVMWARQVGRRSLAVTAAHGRFGQRLFTLPSQKAHQGRFDVATQWQLAQPMLTARVSGPEGFRVTPNPQFASLDDPFVGDRALPVVYAGAGTAADYETVDAVGKIALVTRSDEGLWSQVQAAKEARVAVLLVQNHTEDDVWGSTVWDQGLPTYRLTKAAGARLRQALQENPALTLHLTGVQDSTYSYELDFPESRIPRHPTYHARSGSLATVVSDYRQNSDRMANREGWIPHVGPTGFGNLMSIGRNGPVVRTEYVSTTGVTWQRFAQPANFANMYWTWSADRAYTAGRTYHQLWWGPLVHPAVPPVTGLEEVGAPVARFHDAIRIMVPHYSYGGTRYGFIQTQLGDSSELTLSRNGEVVGKSAWPVAQFSVPAERAEYELSLEVTNGEGNFADTSTHTVSTWRFHSARSDRARAVLPLVQLDYSLDTNGYNEVPSGTTYPLVITPGYQPGATGPEGFTVEVQVSYDDGDTWTSAPVDRVGEDVRATVPAASGPGFGSVRVVATDSAGNQLVQRIDRAWRVAG